MTTAQYRNMARDAEKRCDWLAAAMLWQSAIDAYPTVANDPKSLAYLDLRRMAECRDGALVASRHA